MLTLVDGAQSFGLLDVNLADMQPDFYSGSAHKWPCGARECGVLFVNKAAQTGLADRLQRLSGRVGFSRTFEGFGQRDEATMIAFREALAARRRSAAPYREALARTDAATDDRTPEDRWLQDLDQPDPTDAWLCCRSARELSTSQATAALYEKDKIGYDSRRHRSDGPARLAALLQHDRRDRSPRARARATHGRECRFAGSPPFGGLGVVDRTGGRG